MTNSNYKLTKEDFNQINKRSLFTFQLGWNYERMQASGYLYMILPQLRKMYGDGTPELKEMMKIHTQFFNTSPFFHTIIAGFDLAMEEKDGVASKDAVNGIKTGLMGPFAPLGVPYLLHWSLLSWDRSQQRWQSQANLGESSFGLRLQLLMTSFVGNS